MSKSNISKQVYDIVALIPRGEVATYGDIAKLVGINPRYVGYILHHNPNPSTIPCHRVVSASGKVAIGFAFGGPGAQQQLLEEEGAVFTDGKLALERYRHTFTAMR